MSLKHRAAENKKIRRESLREELKSRTYIQQIERMFDQLDDPNINGVQIKAIQVKMNGYFRLLAKTLPDLKVVGLGE